MTKSTPLPCPFCGHVGLDFREGSTFRWICAECANCGASCGETRVQTIGDGNPLDWLESAKADAVMEWNKRATSAPAWQDAPTCAGLWFCDEGDENPYRFTCHNVSIPLNPYLVGESERWYGPISPDTGSKS